MPAHFSFRICAALGIYWAATSLVLADTAMYKWVDKNGVVSFSQDAPTENGAHDVSRITLESLPVEKQRAAQRLLVNLDKTDDADFTLYQQRMKKADLQIEAAIKKLAGAEENLTRESLPTGQDRVGNDGIQGNHRARLSDSYFERVTQLQAEVELARKELQQAYTLRDNLTP